MSGFSGAHGQFLFFTASFLCSIQLPFLSNSGSSLATHTHQPRETLVTAPGWVGGYPFGPPLLSQGASITSQDASCILSFLGDSTMHTHFRCLGDISAISPHAGTLVNQ